MINMLDFNELDAAKPHVHGKKIGHANMGGGIYRVAARTHPQSSSNSEQLC